MPKFPNFTAEGYVSQSGRVSRTRTVNFYPERIESEGAKARVALYPTPGLATYASPNIPATETSPALDITAQGYVGRGIFGENNRAWAVIGTDLYEIINSGHSGVAVSHQGSQFWAPASQQDAWAGSVIRRGTVKHDGKPAMMTTNGAPGGQLIIASGDELYLLDLTSNAFTVPITNIRMVVMLDGRFIGLDSFTSTLRISNLFNGSVWDPTQITRRSTASDPWRALALTSSKELFVLGEKTGDIYYNSGSSPFPFVPRQGILIKPGIAAPWSLKDVNGAMVWLSNSDGGAGVVVRAQGYNAQRISSESLEYALSRYRKDSRIDDAVAFAYEEQGSWFYELNFPTANATWVWAEKTNWWHERGTYDPASGEYLSWAPQDHAFVFGHHLVTDQRSNRIYRMSIDEFHDAVVDGVQPPLHRMRIAGGLFQEGKEIFVDRFAVYLETGIALTAGQGSDPKIMLRTARDSGLVYGPERWRSTGKLGNFKTPLAQWRKCGKGTDWAFKVMTSDLIPWRIVDALLEARVGS